MLEKFGLLMSPETSEVNVNAQMWGHYLVGTAELFEELGGDLSSLLAEAGCSDSFLQGSSNLIPYPIVARVLEVASRQVNCPDFVLRLANKRHAMGYTRDGILYARAAKTFESAIHGICGHLRSRSLGATYTIESVGTISSFARLLGMQENTRHPLPTLLFFASFHATIKDVLGDKWAPSSISFTFRDPDFTEHLTRYFGCPIQWNAEQDAVFFPSALLTYELPGRDDATHELLSDYLTSLHLSETPDFVEIIKTMIQKNLAVGRCDIDSLALRLPYCTRTLQRKLGECGSSYGELLKDTRFELAENLLAGTDNPLTYVAQHLCYQDLSAFSKAFKNHYGVSPTVWKQRHTFRD